MNQMNPNFNNSQFPNRGNYPNPQPMPPSQNPAPYTQMNPNTGNSYPQGNYQPGPYGNNYNYPYPPRQTPDPQQQNQGIALTIMEIVKILKRRKNAPVFLYRKFFPVCLSGRSRYSLLSIWVGSLPRRSAIP